MAEASANIILDEIENRLKNISKERGYSSGVDGVVERGKMEPWDGIDFPAINYWITGFGNARDQYQTENRDINLFVEIHDATRDEDFVTVANRLAADVVTALCRSTSAPLVSDEPSHDLGGMVEDVLLDGVDLEIGKGEIPFCGALCRFTITAKAELMEMFQIVNM